MALASPYSGSLSTRPTIKKGGVRGAEETPEAFSQRMAARQASNAAPAPITPPTRRDNIITARADGTFEAKRAAFNAGTAQHGRTMDEAGNISGAAPRPSGLLVPIQHATPVPTIPPAPAPGGAAVPAPSPAPVPAPIGPPSTATASAGKISLTPQPAASRLAQRQQRAAATPPPMVPPPRKGGMINDGNGFRPASEVNAGLRRAQEAASTPTTPATTATASTAATPSMPKTMANWTPEEEKAALAAARAREAAASSSAPKSPPASTSAIPEWSTKPVRASDTSAWTTKPVRAGKEISSTIISLGPDGKLVETPASQTHKVIELDKQGNLVEKLVDASGRQIGGSTTSATSSKASPPKPNTPPTPIQPPKPGASASPVMHPSTASGKPRFVPPGSLIVAR